MNRARYLFRKGIAGSFLKWCLNGRYALFHMQLSRLPVRQPVVVVNTICNITALLGFENQSSSLDGMDASRIDLEEVALFHRNSADKCIPLMSAYHRLHLFMASRMVADDNLRSRVAVQNILALRLPQRSVLMDLRILIIRMHLNAQIRLCVNDLDEKRKLISRIIPEKLRLLLPQTAEQPSVVHPAGNAAVSILVGAHGPAFTCRISRNLIAEHVANDSRKAGTPGKYKDKR